MEKRYPESPSMRRLCLALAAAVVMYGCASRDAQLKSLRGDEVQIHNKLIFSAVGGTASGATFYHALLPGKYVETYQDPKYRYYLGEGPLMVLGASREREGGVTGPLAYGGFCIAVSAEVSPQVQLFYLPNKQLVLSGLAVPSTGATTLQGATGAAIGGAIVQELVTSGAIGWGPKSGQPVFVPTREIVSESDALLSSLSAGRKAR